MNTTDIEIAEAMAEEAVRAYKALRKKLYVAIVTAAALGALLLAAIAWGCLT